MTFTKVQNPLGYYSASPLPTVEELSKFYAETYYQNAVSTSYSTIYDETELAYKRLKATALITLALQHRPQAASLLDVGAGEGFLMSAAVDRSFVVTGVDFSSHGIATFHPGLVDRMRVGDVFDILECETATYEVCSAINVLEHVIDPSRLMALLRKVLKDDGVALITVPNDYSRLQTELMERGLIDREFWFAPPQHLHYFNTESLPVFCKSEGFEVIDLVADYPIDLFLLNSGANYIANPALGKGAHRARITADLLIAERGLENYLQYYRGLAAVGLGRDITIVLRQGKGAA